MKILNDSEHRIFLSAMSRERKVCSSAEFWDEFGVNKLLDICDSIERKVNDAEPVRHGHWIKWDDESTYDCSICGDAFTLYEGTPKSNHYYYCPDCGAKMDEVSE